MGKRVQRGEVWWARLDEKRPVVILSGDGARELRAIIIVPPATTDIQGTATELKVGTDEGLFGEGVLRVALPRSDRTLCNWLVTLGEGDLVDRVGLLSPEKLCQLGEILRLGGLE
jgi:mRNA interferase MazF